MSIAFMAFHYFDILSIRALAQFIEERFVRFKDAYGKNSPNKTLSGISETLRHVVAKRHPTKMFFLLIAFQKR